MKGELPVNMIIIVAIAAVALSALGIFFLSSSFSGISDADAQRVFAGGCSRYCTADTQETFRNGFGAGRNDPDFVAACMKLGYIREGEDLLMNRCLSECGNCNLDVSEDEISSGYDNIREITGRGG